MRKGLWSIAVAAALGAAVFLSRGDSAFGQTPAAPPSVDELRERIERLEKQNQELLKTLQGIQSAPRPAPPAAIDHESISQQVERGRWSPTKSKALHSVVTRRHRTARWSTSGRRLLTTCGCFGYD